MPNYRVEPTRCDSAPFPVVSVLHAAHAERSLPRCARERIAALSESA